MESRLIFEVQREGESVVVWEGGIGHRVVYPSEVFAMQQEDLLLENERRFRQAKDSTGVAAIDSFGELVSPWEYLERLFKAYRSKIGQFQGIKVYQAALYRDPKEFW